MSQREIKFRAWNTVLKEMNTVIGNIRFGKDGLEGITMGKTHNWLKDGWFDIKKEDIDKVILMQFTGLLDKNGKEIYEGDILEAVKTEDKLLAVVERVERDGVLVGAYKRVWIKDKLEMYLRFDDREDFVVTSNIYENPELLTP